MMLLRLLVVCIIFIFCGEANASFSPDLNHYISSRAMLPSPPIELKLTTLVPPMYENNDRLDADNDGPNEPQVNIIPAKILKPASDRLLNHEQYIVEDPYQEKGELKLTDGKIYQGEHRNGMPHGLGKMKFADGSQYEGAWKNGVRHGGGNMNFANGDKYTGEWKYDKRYGQGKMIYSDGSYYYGAWDDDYPLIDNMHYHGLFNQNGQAHGASKISKYCDYGGDIYSYQGEWVNGELIGKVVITYCNGDVFCGYINTDKQYHGRGKLMSKGVVYIGSWYNNQLMPSVTIEYKNKTTYQGMCICSYEEGAVSCIPHGHGKFVYCDDSYFEGEWRMGECISRAKIVMPNGEQYTNSYDK